MDYVRWLGEISKFTVVMAVLGFVARSLWSRVLSRDLEAYKAKLLAEHSQEIEHLKADIRAAAFESETRFVRLHDKRVKIIAELYKLLARTAVAFESWMAPLSFGTETMEEKARSATDAANAFFAFFDENQIYLDVALCDLILRLRDAFRRAWADFGAGFNTPKGRQWVEVWQKFQSEIPPLRTEIEGRVRVMLGVIRSKTE